MPLATKIRVDEFCITGDVIFIGPQDGFAPVNHLFWNCNHEEIQLRPKGAK
jgi:hypothetical protein